MKYYVIQIVDKYDNWVAIGAWPSMIMATKYLNKCLTYRLPDLVKITEETKINVPVFGDC